MSCPAWSHLCTCTRLGHPPPPPPHPPPASRACEPAPGGLQMMDKIVSFEGRSEQKRGQEVVLLINNMGSTPPMELYIVAQAAQKYAEEALKV